MSDSHALEMLHRFLYKRGFALSFAISETNGDRSDAEVVLVCADDAKETCRMIADVRDASSSVRILALVQEPEHGVLAYEAGADMAAFLPIDLDFLCSSLDALGRRPDRVRPKPATWLRAAASPA